MLVRFLLVAPLVAVVAGGVRAAVLTVLEPVGYSCDLFAVAVHAPSRRWRTRT